MVRDLIKVLVIWLVLCLSPKAFADGYKVLVLPDNIVTDSQVVDSYIYNGSSEFFADGVVNILNQTTYINSPTVSEARAFLKSSPSNMIPAKNLTNKFRTTYNINYELLDKIATKTNARYVLLITSSIDAENYILRRTIWDFLNIAGATVIDPAYKISTYAVLVDTDRNIVLWSDTFYKTISVVENRIITRGPSPQTEQLQKIRDYSRMLCPEIAQNVQKKILPPKEYDNESLQIYYDMGDFDNNFTKKYRKWHREGQKDYNAAKTRVDAKVTDVKEATKNKYNEIKTFTDEYMEKRAEEKASKAKLVPPNGSETNEIELDVLAEPAFGTLEENDLSKKDDKSKRFSKWKFWSINNKEDQSLYQPVDIKKTRKNRLYGEPDEYRLPLRDYDNL